MAKAKPAETTSAEASEKKFTDKNYATLGMLAEVVVRVGPRQRMQKNKLVTVEEARNVLMTKTGYEQMDRDEEGETKHILSEVIGIPNYITVDAPDTPEGTRKDFEVLHFKDGAGRVNPKAKPETEEADEDEE